MIRARLPLVVPALLGAVVAVVLWSAEGRASNPSPVGVEPIPPALDPAPAPVRSPARVRATLAPEPPARPSASGTAREFLAAWHGEHWPELEARLEAQGLDLDQPYTQRPWDDVAPRIEARLGLSEAKREHLVRAHQRWPETLDVAFVMREFSAHVRGGPLDESDVVAIAALVEPANIEIAAHAELYNDLLDLHVRERWRTGRYVRAPFTTAGLAEERGFHSESHGGDGWSVTITLKHADCPDLVELEQEMDLLRRERDASVMRHLRHR